MDHEPTLELELPGFRFHPTEEELFNFYLRSIVFGKKLRGDVIGFLNIYNHHPMELPGLAKIGEREWYFFVPRDRKHGSGGRPNRTTEHGFWKATGSDRKILSISADPKKMLGLKKTLVFYEGRAPRGTKTDWIMNEYRLPDTCILPKDIVLCKIYRKATSMKVLEERAAIETEIKNSHVAYASLSPQMDSISFCNQFEEVNKTTSESCDNNNIGFKNETDQYIKVVEESCDKEKKCSSTLKLPNGRGVVDIQVPKVNMDWSQDSFWSQLSPWLENFTSFVPLC